MGHGTLCGHFVQACRFIVGETSESNHKCHQVPKLAVRKDYFWQCWAFSGNPDLRNAPFPHMGYECPKEEPERKEYIGKMPLGPIYWKSFVTFLPCSADT